MRTAVILASILALASTASATACSTPQTSDDAVETGNAVTAGVIDVDEKFASVAVSRDGTPLTAPEVGYVCNEPGVGDAPGKAIKFKIEDEEELVDPAGKPRFGFEETSAPRKFAARTVLAALRRMRRYYNSIPYSQGGVELTAPGAHAEPSGSDYNTSDDGRAGGNMAVMPPNWNDIQPIFYVSAARMRHACWTYIFWSGPPATCRGAAAFKDGYDAKDLYSLASALCSGAHEVSGACAAAFSGASEAINVNLSAYNLMWVVPGKGGKANEFVALPEEIRNDMTSSKPKEFAAAQLAAGNVNVWDYIMQQGSLAWDREQQEAVANTYYGDNKAFSGDTAHFDPCNTTECARWRTARPGDPRDGTQCRTTKTNGVKNVGPWNGR